MAPYGIYYDQQEKQSEQHFADALREEAKQFNMNLSEYMLFQIMQSARDMQAEIHEICNLIDERTR